LVVECGAAKRLAARVFGQPKREGKGVFLLCNNMPCKRSFTGDPLF
jgi:hypothetical protein